MAPGGDTNDGVFPTPSRKTQRFTTSTGTLTSPSLPSSSNSPGGDLRPPLTLPTLPFELMEVILCRLPVKSLLRFRCVCKTWNSLISDPKFARRHLREFNRYNLIVKSRNHVNSYSHSSTTFNNTMILSSTRLQYPLNHDIRNDLVGSCDGMLCFCAPNGACLVWNPSIRTSIELPPLEHIKVESLGFGYDILTETYKVVIVIFASSYHARVVVQTLGTNSWRSIEDFTGPSYFQEFGKFVSGTINWLAGSWSANNWSNLFINSLDLVKESWSKLCLPDVYDPTLGVLRDCLCVLYEKQFFWDVWVMKEHGNNESWTRLFNIPIPVHNGGLGYVPRNHSRNSSEDDEGIMLQSLPSFTNLVVYKEYGFNDDIFTIFCIGNNQAWMLPEIYHEPVVCAESLISPCFQY